MKFIYVIKKVYVHMMAGWQDRWDTWHATCAPLKKHTLETHCTIEITPRVCCQALNLRIPWYLQVCTPWISHSMLSYEVPLRNWY